MYPIKEPVLLFLWWFGSLGSGKYVAGGICRCRRNDYCRSQCNSSAIRKESLPDIPAQVVEQQKIKIKKKIVRYRRKSTLWKTCIRFGVLDKYTDFIVQSPLIKGSNLRFKTYVCSVVSTVETSGTARNWWDFYCMFCHAIKVSFFIRRRKNNGSK